MDLEQVNSKLESRANMSTELTPLYSTPLSVKVGLASRKLDPGNLGVRVWCREAGAMDADACTQSAASRGSSNLLGWNGC